MNISQFVANDSQPQLALQVVGAISILAILYRLLDFVYLYFLRPSQLKQYLIDSKNLQASSTLIASESSETKSWALVTGASDGIGKSLAHQLAQAGFNVVLHGRNPTKLDGVLKGLQEANPGTHFRVLVSNASHSHGMRSTIAGMAEDLDSLPGPLTILINNVGGTSPTPNVFTPLRELDHKEVDGLVTLNATFAVQLTRALLPGILARNVDLNAKAAIVFVGSAAQIGIPMESVYSGAKSFLRVFTRALGRELLMEGYAGVSAMYCVVGNTTYAGPWQEPPTFFTPTAEAVARTLLHKVGCGRSEVTPYWSHSVQVAGGSSMPEWVLTRIIIHEVRESIVKTEEQAKKA